MDRQGQRAALIAFLETVVKPERDLAGIDDDTNLVRADLIDSFALIQVIFHLEQEHGVDLSALGIDPVDLNTIGGMLAAIARANE